MKALDVWLPKPWALTNEFVSFLLENAMKAVSGVFVSSSPAPKEECALEIIKGGALRQREVYYEYTSTKIPLLIRDWAPGLLDYLIRKNYNVEKLQEN